MKVFLGGTCNESNWRNRMMIYLTNYGIDYFNPVVDDWDEKAQKNELKEREKCDVCLYTITPKMLGFYSIAEVVDDSNKKPEKTILILLKEDEFYKFSKEKWKSLKAVANLVKRNGGKVFYNLHNAAVEISKI